MSPRAAARKRFGGVGSFSLGCGCKDPKAVAVAASASSPWSATEASTATSTATSRRGRSAHPSASASSTGTLTVPSASSSSFLWEDAEADGGDEAECKRASSAATTPSFSGLLRQLGELEQGVKSCGRKSSSPRRDHFSQPPPPPPPPPLRPVLQQQRRALRSVDDKPGGKEGHGNFSPPRPPPLTQQHRRVKSVDKVNRQEGDALSTPLPRPPRPLPPPPPEEELRNVKAVDGVNNKGDGKQHSPTPQQLLPGQRRAKSFDGSSNGFGGGVGLDGSVAVVKQSEDPLSDFRRSMLNMIVENGIVTGDELRELLRRFLALNAPRHHDAILRAFAEIWDEVFASAATAGRDAAARRQRTPPPRRRHPLPAWRV